MQACRGCSGMLSWKLFGILTPSLLSWVSEFQLGNLLLFKKKYIFIVKNLTDSHKTVEIGMDPCLIPTVSA